MLGEEEDEDAEETRGMHSLLVLKNMMSERVGRQCAAISLMMNVMRRGERTWW